MEFLDKLQFLMEKKGIKNLNVLSEESGIPYMTLKSFYTKGTSNIKLSTLNKLKTTLDCTLDYLVDDRNTDPNYGKEISLPKISGINEKGEYIESFSSDEVLEIISDLADMPEEALKEFKAIAEYIKSKYKKG